MVYLTKGFIKDIKKRDLFFVRPEVVTKPLKETGSMLFDLQNYNLI